MWCRGSVPFKQTAVLWTSADIVQFAIFVTHCNEAMLESQEPQVSCLNRPATHIHEARLVATRLQARRIDKVHGIAGYIRVKVDAALKPYRVFAQESSRDAVVIPGAVISQSGFGIKVPPRVLERIDESSSCPGEIAKRIVEVCVRQSARGVA